MVELIWRFQCKRYAVENPDGLAISAFLEREDPRDVLVLRSDSERVIKLASGVRGG